MSAKINRGDILHFENTIHYDVRHTIYEEPEIALRPTRHFVGEATVLLVHYIDGLYIDGYLVAEEGGRAFLVNLPDLYLDKTASINSTTLQNQLSPNKWDAFIKDQHRKIPEALATSACPAFPKYARLIKKYVPLRRRVYLWACTKWRNLVG